MTTQHNNLAFVHLRTDTRTKALWQASAKKQGKTLSSWVMARLGTAPGEIDGVGNTPVARWRNRIGLSQEKAACALGVTVPTFQRYEYEKNMQTGKPSPAPKAILLACATIEREISPIL